MAVKDPASLPDLKPQKEVKENLSKGKKRDPFLLIFKRTGVPTK